MTGQRRRFLDRPVFTITRPDLLHRRLDIAIVDLLLLPRLPSRRSLNFELVDSYHPVSNALGFLTPEQPCPTCPHRQHPPATLADDPIRNLLPFILTTPLHPRERSPVGRMDSRPKAKSGARSLWKSLSSSATNSEPR